MDKVTSNSPLTPEQTQSEVTTRKSNKQKRMAPVSSVIESHRKTRFAADHLERSTTEKKKGTNVGVNFDVKVEKTKQDKESVFNHIRPSSEVERKKIKEVSEVSFSLGLPYVFSRHIDAAGKKDEDGCSFANILSNKKPNLDSPDEDLIAWKKGTEEAEFYCILKKGSPPIRLGTVKDLEKKGINDVISLGAFALPKPDIDQHQSISTEINRGRVFFSVLLEQGLVLQKNRPAAKFITKNLTNNQINSIKADLLVLSAGFSPNHFLKSLLKTKEVAFIRSGEFGASPITIAKRWKNEENVSLLRDYGVNEFSDPE